MRIKKIEKAEITRDKKIDSFWHEVWEEDLQPAGKYSRIKMVIRWIIASIIVYLSGFMIIGVVDRWG